MNIHEIVQLTALEAAPRLLGKMISRITEDGEIRCRIVETESYGGAEDKGSHAYGNRRTARTEMMFRQGGYAYIYLIYGMYHCLNVVTGDENDPQAVLIRAVEPLTPKDEQLMLKHRPAAARQLKNISNGPGKLCQALSIDKSCNGLHLLASGGTLRLEDPPEDIFYDIESGPRINIDYAQEYAAKPWRFYIKNHPYISAKNTTPLPYLLERPPIL
ncbi:DNA-3-methyladenine glycosylase [Paenibacillus bovis]|uniref:Putative 3-methyladenine DNA glycosylase n=1 Tax=Paenibacillus bovis TaxID=1616788 RepID=A0A172ZDC9_9BACL|nr:DNA-3-methyladenine glycosylase [Paenibacillus bovis]ANF95160.1 3-methyladenine DNA glycosylase [Paenibacillus bovis]